MSIDIFLNQTLYELTDCLYWFIQNTSKRYEARRYFLPKGVIKYYNVIIIGKNFYDQPIDSDIKRYEEIRKLITGQGEDYIPQMFVTL